MADASKGAAGSEQDGVYAWYVLGVLIVAYTFSYLDRQALTLLVGPIRKTLDISDTQLSLLHGFAFAIFYSMLGLPIGRMIDRHRRVTIVASGVALWSLMTALCGLANNFARIGLARVGVGVGEAVLTPGAHSLLSDYFSVRRRPMALSLFVCAIYFGSGLATIICGTLIAFVPTIDTPIFGHLEPWQTIFIIIGLPGLLIALWVLSVREPKRTGLKADVVPAIGTTLRHMKEHGRAYGQLIFGYSAFMMMWNGSITWFPTYFIRVHGWSTAQTGSSLGMTIISAGILGVVTGGRVSVWLRDKGFADSNILIGIFAVFIAMPAGMISGMLGNAAAALIAFFFFQLGCAMPIGSAFAALQEITPNQMRGQVAAIQQLIASLFGIGLGPTVVALFTDRVFRNDLAVGSSITLAIALSGPVAITLLSLARKSYKQTLTAIDF